MKTQTSLKTHQCLFFLQLTKPITKAVTKTKARKWLQKQDCEVTMLSLPPRSIFWHLFDVGEAIRRNMDKECYNKCNKDCAHQAFGHPTFPTQLVMCSTPLSPLYIMFV